MKANVQFCLGDIRNFAAYKSLKLSLSKVYLMIKVFGHKAPDTDSTGSAIIWAWYLNKIKGQAAKAVLLGVPNTEANFVLNHWGIISPEIITDVADNEAVIIVDTNNPAELPNNINNADIQALIDHHKFVGGLETSGPIDITIRPLACTATIMHNLMGENAKKMPDEIKGIMLSCILSDTLEFRSPTTTDHDHILAKSLGKDLDISIPAYAAQMFAAKSDLSSFSDVDLLRMDSKEYTVSGIKFRISVLETTCPETVVDRKVGLMASMPEVAKQDGVEQVLLFVVDILNGEATMLIPNALSKSLAERSFGVSVTGDTVKLAGIMSRKKQIVPNLKL